MADRAQIALSNIREKYEPLAARPSFERLYEEHRTVGHVFAVLHHELNKHFVAINGRINSTKHYWADNSRDLMALIEQIDDDLHTLTLAGIEARLDARYREAIEGCEAWLSGSGGSPIPDDFERIDVIKYDPVFTTGGDKVDLGPSQTRAELKMVGEGSFATVYRYVDPLYDLNFAVKRARRNLGERDLARFRREFEVMKKLSFPYVLDVYTYDNDRNEYRMEYCDQTLRTYIAKRNRELRRSARKRIALQFLYGINYIHSQGLLHRDISLQNVLLKVYESGAVLVKLSDFGLVKEASSEFTRKSTEAKGTIVDPMLRDFKDYGVANEIYAVGWILAYVFTGKESLDIQDHDVAHVVRRCTSHTLAERYTSVADSIADIEQLPTATPGTTA